MTEPLSIKDLNCSTCSLFCEGKGGDFESCPALNNGKWAGQPKVKIQSLKKELLMFTKYIGCASHPLALQVLAAPVIKELEKCITTWNENLQPSDDYESGIISGLDVAINLLKGGA